jgi:hypothetical protein
MRRARHKLQVSTFPFLAVLLAAMGSLILLLLVMDRRAKIVARAKAQEALAARRKQNDGTEEQRRRDWENQRAALHAQLASQVQEIVSRQAAEQNEANQIADKLRAELVQLQALDSKLRQEQASLEKERQAIGQRQSLLAKSQSTTREFLTERQRVADQLAQLEAAWRDLQLLKGKEQNTYSLVAYRGKRGENRQPIYVECRRESVVFHPSGKVLSRLELTEEGFRAEVKARGAELERVPHHQPGTRKRPPPPQTGPYVLFLIRPDAITTYYEAAAALSGYQIDFGYELIERDWVLDFGGEPGPVNQMPEVAQQPAIVNQGSRPAGGNKSNGTGHGGGASYAGGSLQGASEGQGLSESGIGLGSGSQRVPLVWAEPGFTSFRTSVIGSPGGGGDPTHIRFGSFVPVTSGGRGSRGGSTSNGLGSGSNFEGSQPSGQGFGQVALGSGGGGEFQGTGQGGGPSQPGNGSRGTPGSGGSGIPGGRGEFQGTGQGDGPSPPGTGSRGGSGSIGSGINGQGSGAQPGDGPSHPGNGSRGASGSVGAGISGGGEFNGSRAPGQGAGQGDGPSQPGNGPRQPGSTTPDWRPANPGPRGSSDGSGNVSNGQPPDAPGTPIDPLEVGKPDKRKNPINLGGSNEGAERGDPFSRLPLPQPPTKDQPKPKPAPAPPRVVGNRDFVITIECSQDSAAVYPGGKTFDITAGSQTAALTQYLQQLLTRREASVRPGEPPYRPRLRLQVQPDGLRTYYRLLPSLEALRLPMARENLEE